MEALVQWLIYGLPSLLVGMLLGLFLERVVRREVVEEIELEHELPEPIKERAVPRQLWASWSTMTRILGVFVLVVTIGSAIMVSVQSNRVARLAEETDRRDQCVTSVLTDLTESLNETTEIQGQVSAALREKIAALVVALDQVLTPTSREEVVAAFEDYREKAQAYLDLSAQAAERRREFPVPEVSEISDCL